VQIANQSQRQHIKLVFNLISLDHHNGLRLIVMSHRIREIKMIVIS